MIPLQNLPLVIHAITFVKNDNIMEGYVYAIYGRDFPL